MSPALADVVRVLTLVMAGAIFLYLVWQSRKWHGPVQSARIDEIESDVRTIRGNLARIERDTTHHYREYMQCNDRILKELEAMRDNGGRHEICDELKVIEDRLADIEQVVASMPCQPKCKPDGS